MELYHAGAAIYERGEAGLSGEYLIRFLDNYVLDDSWRVNAPTILAEIG
jgi:hypothetical protein